MVELILINSASILISGVNLIDTALLLLDSIILPSSSIGRAGEIRFHWLALVFI